MKESLSEQAQPHRFYYIVSDYVRRYRDDLAVAWSFSAALYVDRDPQYPMAYCGHDHRDPDQAKACGERMLRRVERGAYPADYCPKSERGRHLVRSSDTCVYCEKRIES